MNYSSYAHRSAREGTDISRHKPFIVKIALQALFQPTNVFAGGYEVAKEKYVRSMLEYYFHHLLQGTNQVPAPNVQIAYCERAGPCVHAELACEILLLFIRDRQGGLV
jgi:hypothetical protein